MARGSTCLCHLSLLQYKLPDVQAVHSPHPLQLDINTESERSLKGEQEPSITWVSRVVGQGGMVLN